MKLALSVLVLFGSVAASATEYKCNDDRHILPELTVKVEGDTAYVRTWEDAKAPTKLQRNSSKDEPGYVAYFAVIGCVTPQTRMCHAIGYETLELSQKLISDGQGPATLGSEPYSCIER